MSQICGEILLPDLKVDSSRLGWAECQAALAAKRPVDEQVKALAMGSAQGFGPRLGKRWRWVKTNGTILWVHHPF